MGKFDREINWCRERRRIAKEDITAFEEGMIIHINDEDMTPKLMDKAKSDVEMFDRLIATYTEQNG